MHIPTLFSIRGEFALITGGPRGIGEVITCVGGTVVS